MKGKKNDNGKAPVTQLLRQFPDAIKYISKVSEHGHNKYGDLENDDNWDNWRHVENAKFRYEQAIGRHLLEKSDSLDEDSNMLSIAHTAWNCLAVLQIILEKQNLKNGNKNKS